MAYTRHGHHIVSSRLVTELPKEVARCGGPGPCSVCNSDASIYWAKLKQEELADKMDDIPQGPKAIKEYYPKRTEPIKAIFFDGTEDSANEVIKWLASYDYLAMYFARDQEDPYILYSGETAPRVVLKKNYYLLLTKEDKFYISDREAFLKNYEMVDRIGGSVPSFTVNNDSDIPKEKEKETDEEESN